MAGERVKLEVRKRDRVGSRDSKRLRRDGLIPGVLYGRGKDSYAICVPERELRRVLTGDAGMHAILDVVLDGQQTTHPSILKEYQHDPIRGKLVHVDLQEVPLDEPIHATVTVMFVGAEDAPGVREGGALSQVAREVNVDVSGMAIGDTLLVSDLPRQAGVTLLDDPDTVVATLTVPTRFEEPEIEVEEGEEGELPEGEVPAEGEAAPAAEGEADSGESGEPGTTEG